MFFHEIIPYFVRWGAAWEKGAKPRGVQAQDFVFRGDRDGKK